MYLFYLYGMSICMANIIHKYQLTYWWWRILLWTELIDRIMRRAETDFFENTAEFGNFSACSCKVHGTASKSFLVAGFIIRSVETSYCDTRHWITLIEKNKIVTKFTIVTFRKKITLISLWTGRVVLISQVHVACQLLHEEAVVTAFEGRVFS